MASQPTDEPDWADDFNPAPKQRQPQRHRQRGSLWPILGAAAAITALAVGGAVWAIRAEKQQKLAILTAEREAMEAERAMVERRLAAEAEAERLKALERLDQEFSGDANTQPILVDDAEALNRLGQFLIETGEYDRAVDELRKAQRLDPRFTGNLNAALRLRERLHHTAPPPREVERP